MRTFVKDPLLTAAKIIINLFLGLMAIGIVALAIGLPALLLNQELINAELIKDGHTVVDANFFLGASIAMAFGAAILALGIWFLLLLRQIVGTVAAGDPFTGENATRLSKMGWIALAEQLLTIPLGILISWAGSMVEDHDAIRVEGESGFSGGGLVLILLLFILARVFRHGAAMRQDLEGTV